MATFADLRAGRWGLPARRALAGSETTGAFAPVEDVALEVVDTRSVLLRPRST